MFKVYKIIAFFLLLAFTIPSYAHVQHYEKLNSIKFDIYRNNKLIGTHIFSFKKKEDQFIVESEVDFQIKKLGVVLYDYYVNGTEVYEDGELIKFNSKTDQNGKQKFVNMLLANNKYKIDGSSFQGLVPTDYMLGTWWNHSIVKAKAQISAVSGRIIKQKVTFLGNETITIDNKIYETLHFNFSSSDKSLDKDKKLNTDIWYEKDTLNWVKASFNKKGSWEYKLVSIK